MKKALRHILAALLLATTLSAHAAQQFFNLTAGEVRVHDGVPTFTHQWTLPDDYRDSIYTVTLAYPEYIDMPAAQAEKFCQLCDTLPPALPTLHQNITFDRKQPALSVDFCPVVYREGRYQLLVSFMLKLEAKAKTRSQRRASTTSETSAADRYAAHSVLASGRWVKIRVPETGVYQLTESLIRQAGFSSLSKVKIYGYGGNLRKEVLSAADITAHDDLKEVATCTIAGRRLFYAQGPVSWDNGRTSNRVRNYCSDYGYYFLTESDDEPLATDTAALAATFAKDNNSYMALHEVDSYAWYEGGRKLYDSQSETVGQSHSVTFTKPANASSATMRIIVSAQNTSQISVEHNGKQIGSFTVRVDNSGTNAFDAANESGSSYRLAELADIDTITYSVVSGGPTRLDFVQMAYDKPRPTPDFENATFPTPEYVYAITNQDHHADPQADMVIIIPTSQKTLAQAQRLKAFHEEHDGMRVNIVPADELYNEFSSGTPDVSAYRHYMKMLYDRAATEADAPKYLILFGDCVWDNRLLTSTCRNLDENDLLLCHESENSYNKVSCYVDDGFYCYLDDGEGDYPLYRDKLDVAVGRFPVTTVEQAKIMVDKVISYAQNKNIGAWQNTLMFMGDDGDSNQHMKAADDAAKQVINNFPGYNVKKVMWDSYERETNSTGATYPQVTSIIKAQQQAGALIMDYAGHGREDQMSHERVLTLSDFAGFTNQNLPLWITASCDIMPFDAMAETIGETAVLNENGGAIAFFGTTRTVYATYNTSMNQKFIVNVLTQTADGKLTTIGEAARQAKNLAGGTLESTNNLQYSLLGDPALTLCLPSPGVVLDEINGKPLASLTDSITLHAGDIVTLKGHVKDASFNGTVTATLRDSRETITCRRNDKDAAKTAFTYEDRTKTLFQGSDSVRAGQFEFTFAVPKDINYSYGTGQVNFFAVDPGRTLGYNGSNEGFYVGGSNLAPNDSVGPSIFCYLNSPSFVNGGEVNATPYFVAEVTDQNGINAAGSGIGHDLQLTIDGKQSLTYNLNDNFTFDFGTYTSGSTFYNIPELENGQHTLTFRAWDILNNMSEAQLSFRVVRGIQPTFSISCTDNPATTSTTFIVSHDRTGSDMEVEVEVLDTSGRLLWRRTQSGTSVTSNFTIDWDLTNEDGQRLETGIYLYRVTVNVDGASKRSKAKKLVVINNK